MMHTKAKIYKMVALLMVVILSILNVGMVIEADLSELPLKDKYSNIQDVTSQESNAEKVPYYSEVLGNYIENGYKDYDGEDITINAVDFTNASEQPKKEPIDSGDRPVVVWNGNTKWIEWSVDVKTSGIYAITVDAYCLDENGSDAVRGITIDDKTLFSESSNLLFKWNWKDKTKPQKNDIGDEIAPSQELVKKWKSFELRDRDGVHANPFGFYLTEGKHTIRMQYIDKDIAISQIKLHKPIVSKSYAEIQKEYKVNGYSQATKPIKFQAEEHIVDKNSNTLRLVSNDDPSSYPYKHGVKLLNSVGDHYWSKGNQSFTWEFDVEESGLYKIGMRALQWFNPGQASYRQIMIDGKVPFKELEAYKFSYKKDWSAEFLSDASGNPYEIYLEGGKKHTITMTVTLGEYGLISQELYAAAIDFSELMLKITMITGPNPDANYEYKLEKQIPNLIEDLKNIEATILRNVDKLYNLSGKNSPAISSLKQSASQIRSVIDKPDTIPKRIENLNNCQANIVTWYTSIKQQPLLIDYFMIDPINAQTPKVKSNFLQKFMATVKNFLISFTKDYNSIGGLEETERTTLKVFTTLGTERGEIMKLLADETFSKEHNVSLDLKIVPAGQANAGQVNALMLSLASGNAPDVAIGVDTTSPSEFAFRGVAKDLSALNGFDLLRNEFIPTAFDSMTFMDKVYGVPETMDFRVLMYRKDIINNLGIKIPNTWEDVYNNVLPVLYQSKLTFYMPQDFGIFLYQNGGRYYSDDGLTSALDTPEAYSAFKEMTELYTSYGVPYAASFLNRFRSGEIPMGIATFADYLQVSVAAPELAGKWDIALLPGHVRPDSTIDRSFTKAIKTASLVFDTTEHTEESWEFVKWWSSSKTQSEYGRRIEDYLGPDGRWNTANIMSYKKLPWNKDHLEVISSMWGHAKEVPPVLGGYFTDRHFTNAWNRIIVESNSSMTMRDSLEIAVEEINKELVKKQNEYKHLLK